eukprot:3131260-Amphidinium_carterae.1
MASSGRGHQLDGGPWTQRGRPAYCPDLCTIPETLRATAFDMSQCDSTGSLAQHCMESSVASSRGWPPQQGGGLRRKPAAGQPPLSVAGCTPGQTQ